MRPNDHRFFDKDPSQIDNEELNHYLKHNPSRTSIKSIEHLAQHSSHFDGHFRKLDYGHKGNQQQYGSDTPPAHDLSAITSKIYMYYGDNDFLCTLKNIEMLAKALQDNKTRFYPGWGHFSFLLGKNRQAFMNDLLTDIENDS